jgi:molybdopterin/thiamine biosynthesis adenylyltransferase
MAKVAVVGCGMIGSAAMKYLALAGVDVVGFSSREPSSYADHDRYLRHVTCN